MVIYNFKHTNEACGLKLIWNFIEKDNLRSCWMKNRYLKQESFWDTRLKVTRSRTWKWVLGLRTKEVQHLERRSMDGKTISLWFDPWINGSNLMEKLSIDSVELLEFFTLSTCAIVEN